MRNKTIPLHSLKKDEVIKRIFISMVITFAAMCFVDCMAATQLSSVLAPVKSEINDFIDFGVPLIWIIGIVFFFFMGLSKGNIVMGSVIGIVLPSIVTALALSHKFS